MTLVRHEGQVRGIGPNHLFTSCGAVTRGAAPRLAYLIPEFPGQTHAFFWRERARLERMGASVALFSTRRPPSRVRARHEWTAEAEGLTRYLMPLGPVGLSSVVRELVRVGPRGWARAGRAYLASEAPGVGAQLRLLAAVLLGARLAAEARAARIGHIHAHSCANAANVAMFAQRLSGLEYSITLHNPLSCYGPNQPEKWRHARFAIVITQAIRHEVESTLEGHLPSILLVAPMGVDEERFRREFPYEPFGGDGVFRIFSCSRLNPGKAVDDLVRAVSVLVDRGLDAHLKVAGADDVGGSYLESLETLAVELGISERVRFLGAVGESEVLEQLRHAHVFALASLTESLGIAIAEAMAVEVPIVATRVGGVPELVDEGVNGFLVEPRAPAALAAALARIAGDRDLAARFSRSSRQRIVESFHSGVSAAAIFRAVTAPAD